jgi:phospholipase C
VIFDENVSFDHYFGTYPDATNPAGEPAFRAKGATPGVNGLSGALLTHNPNGFNPVRLDRSHAVTCDQDHGYTAEQLAFDHGLMDAFPQNTDSGDCTTPTNGEFYPADPSDKLVMDYYDGNTVTALWNYAQRFAMSDNSFGTEFGPSTPGALNLISGQTHGATVAGGSTSSSVPGGTVIGDPNPSGDLCDPSQSGTVTMSGQNVGDLLNARGVTWGWFQGGFAPTSRLADGTPVCGATHTNIAGGQSADYSPHHNPFEYYASTANPKHLPPTSVAMIGRTDQANHEYDLRNFWQAVNARELPAVSFLKAAEYQDGHAGYSDPLDEQRFLVDTINRLQRSPQWRSTAVVIAYDDSDGWYDHVMAPILHSSADSANDALNGPGLCGNTVADGAYQDRCGYGPRLPLLVVSPFAKRDYVDNTLTDQSSILRAIEDNWQLGRIGGTSTDADAGTLANLFDFSRRPHDRAYLLNPTTGEPLKSRTGHRRRR